MGRAVVRRISRKIGCEKRAGRKNPGGTSRIRSTVSVIFCHRGFRLFFYSNEGYPRELPHVHVEKDDTEAKFWLALLDIVEANRDRIERAWDEFFG